MKDVLIFSLVYFLGAFVTKVIIVSHDKGATIRYRVGSCSSEMMTMWFIALPLMLIAQLFYIIYKAGSNVGEWMYKRLYKNK